MTREPDRFEAKARELLMRVQSGPMVFEPDPRHVAGVAAALAAEAAETLKRLLVDVGDANMDVRSAIRRALRALASPAAAPAAETCRIGGTPHEVTPLCVPEPAAPALDANEIVYRCEHAGHPVSACTVCLPLARMATLESAAGAMCWRCKADPHHRDLENCSASPIRALAIRRAALADGGE